MKESQFEPLPIIQWDDYPEAETMESRRTRHRLEGAFCAFLVTAFTFALLWLMDGMI